MRLARSLPPRAAAWLLTGCAAALAACTAAALGLLTAAGALRLPPVAALGHLSLPLLGGDPVVSVPAAGVAAALLTACALAVVHRTLRHHTELRTARRTTDAHPPSGDLCVLPDSAPDAYALPGRPGRVVVTAGMLRALPPDEREALFAHERAHLAGGTTSSCSRSRWPRSAIRCSGPCARPSRTPWSAGPMKRPRPGWATAVSRPAPSAAPRWPPAPLPRRRTVPAPSSPRRPGRYPAGSPPCWPLSGPWTTLRCAPVSTAAV